MFQVFKLRNKTNSDGKADVDMQRGLSQQKVYTA